MELISEIRRRHFVGGESISALSRSVGLSRPTIRKHLMTTTPPFYSRPVKPGRQLGRFEERSLDWLETEKRRPVRERRTAQRLYEGLQQEGYEGAYDSVQRYVRRWKRNNPSGATASGTGIKAAFVPLAFSPGEACQFDWSHERVGIGGVVQTVKVAHFRLSHSRQCFVAGLLMRLFFETNLQANQHFFERCPADFDGAQRLTLQIFHHPPADIVAVIATG